MNAAQKTVEWQKQALFQAINECDTMILQADIDNDAESFDHRQTAMQLSRHKRRRNALAKHRELLENLYKSLYNETP